MKFVPCSTKELQVGDILWICEEPSDKCRIFEMCIGHNKKTGRWTFFCLSEHQVFSARASELDNWVNVWLCR